MEKRRQFKSFLKSCNCKGTLDKVESDLLKIDEYIGNVIGSKNAAIVKEHMNSVHNEDGRFSQIKLWKLKRKLCPNTSDPPLAKRDEIGNLVTAPEKLRALYARTYLHRLRCREMKPELMDVLFLKEALWSSRMKELKLMKTEDWNMNELEIVLNDFKNNKATDPMMLINEIFKVDCIGQDLENALLLLCNGIKESLFIPDYMRKQNITTIYKNKGSRLDMKNDRGIFILTSLRRILDKLIYRDKYEMIDQNMSDSNIGARRGRQVKNHLFILHGVINSVINGHESPIDIQFYDLEQAFDALWLTDCLIDLFDTLPPEKRDDELALLYTLSKENYVSVSTPHGLTERMCIRDIIQQGGTWGPVLCSNSIDTISKKIMSQGESCYMYRKKVQILPLAMVDDICAISTCGLDSLRLNTSINSHIELKKLRFHVPNKEGKSKCHKLHVGVKSSTCPVLKVHGTIMEEVSEDDYLGDVISADGKNSKNFNKRISRGMGLISQIINMLDIVSFGHYYIETAMLFRESVFLNSLLNNMEVWYGITSKEMKTLEDLDMSLLRRILKAPLSTPKEAFFLELGILPIGVSLKMRRIKYLHYLLQGSKQEMLGKFFWLQWNSPLKGDWVNTVRQDLADFGMSADSDILKRYSKNSFAKLVKSKAMDYAFYDLMKRKSNHTKMRYLNYFELRMQNYFTLPEVHISSLRKLFLFRVHMLGFAENFRGQNGSRLCPLCSLHADSQDLLASCVIVSEMFEGNIQDDIDNIYSKNLEIKSIKILTRAISVREKVNFEN